ncbi:hypothetical protein [Actinoplanes sp. NPDC049599]|uniref:hypothetical protein n=1 Tax=Actinoplanes sp. NPDC049599 TaxID=3363903 RepID=UPI0037A68D3F
MITRLSAFLNRHRRALPAAGLAVTAGEIAAVPGTPMIAYAVITAGGGAAAVAGWWLTRRARADRGATLVADARARTLATPRTGADVLFAGAVLQAFALCAGRTTAAALDGDLSRAGLLGALLFAGLLAVTARSLPHGVGVVVGPGGIRADKLTGELAVPWEALAADQPGPGADPRELTLAYARPELIRATGLVPDRTTLEFEGVDRAVLAAAIHRYARHPAARHAIGTEAEQARLRAEPGPIRYGVLPLPEPPTPRATAARALTGAVLVAGAVTLQTVFDPQHPYWSLLAVPPAWLGLRRLRRAWSGWQDLRDIRRPAN